MILLLSRAIPWADCVFSRFDGNTNESACSVLDRQAFIKDSKGTAVPAHYSAGT